jgi:enoyl-CoA hydratase/carnithine racemase
VWRQVPVPVIAAIHGATFGGGLQVALGADMRIAAPDTQLSVMEIKWGLIPDMGISKTLLQLVRGDVAKELTFTGRIVEADEALALGLITRIADDPFVAALSLAKSIAEKSPHAIRAAKALFDQATDLDVAEAFKLETALQLPILGSENQMEALQAAMMKRPAKFSDPQ